jgi:hypothetical protein
VTATNRQLEMREVDVSKGEDLQKLARTASLTLVQIGMASEADVEMPEPHERYLTRARSLSAIAVADGTPPRYKRQDGALDWAGGSAMPNRSRFL